MTLSYMALFYIRSLLKTMIVDYISVLTSNYQKHREPERASKQ